MAIISRAERVSHAFVKIADTLVADYDVVGIFHALVNEFVDIFDATASGLLLVDPAGGLQVMASSSEDAGLLQLLELDADEGPSVGCFASGTIVALDDIAAQGGPWPDLQAAAAARGLRSQYVVPMRLREQVIGTLTLFRHELSALSAEDFAIAQAFADVATISLLQERALRESTVLNEQLQHALNSRITIEQAKGAIAHLGQVDVNEAFELLRSYARSHNLSLSETAQRVLNRTLGFAEL